MLRPAVSLLAVLLLAGCPAQKLYHDGVQAEASGKDWLAADDYIAALNHKPGLDKARQALFAIAPDAYAKQLARCEAAETAKDWPTAIKQYGELKEFIDRVDREGGPVLTGVDLGGKIADLQDSAAREIYDRGEKALSEKRWADAIAAYQDVTKYKANYKDTVAKIGAAHYGWAESDLASKAWRDAASEFTLAAGSSGPANATARATGIYAALGKYQLDKGACRQAVRDLTVASQKTKDATVAKNLTAAKACAAVPIAFLPSENPTGIATIDGLAVGDDLNDSLASRTRSEASENLQILERAVLDSLLAESGLTTTTATRGSTKLKGVRYFVVTKFTQIKVDQPAVAADRKTTPGKRQVACTQTDANGAQVAATCPEDVTVSYIEHHGSLTVQFAGSIRAVDARTGEQVFSQPFDLKTSDETHWVDGFRVDRTDVDPGTVGLSADLVSLASARRELIAPSELAKDTLDGIADSATKPLLSVIDGEAAWTDPPALTVVALP